MIETGVIHGRFQVLHNDHLIYLMAGKSRCRYLVVGITNPDPVLTKDDPADPQRSHPMANPLSYYERYIMIQTVLTDEGLKVSDFCIVPFPINYPELFGHYVPMDGTFFLTIYDDWGRRKLEKFKSLDLKTEILWERPPQKKGLRATDIRQRMIKGERWEHFVPKGTEMLMKKLDIPKRLSDLASN